MERNSDSPIASSDAEAAYGGADAVNDTPGIARHGATPGSNLPPGPVVERKSRGGIWLFVALLVVVALIYLAKGMM
jgi:hypothetical protein